MPDGRRLQGTEVGFRSSGEHWNEYLLDDGSVVRLKPVAMTFTRIDGEYDPTGEPMYMVNSQQIVSVSAADELRRPE